MEDKILNEKKRKIRLNGSRGGEHKERSLKVAEDGEGDSCRRRRATQMMKKDKETI